MTTIPWTLCSDRMPPDDGSEILVRHLTVDRPALRIWAFQVHTNKRYGMLDDNWEWIPFDEATWNELNDES